VRNQSHEDVPPCSVLAPASASTCTFVSPTPHQNGFVERSKRTYQEECLALDQPADARASQSRDRGLAAALQHRAASSCQGLSGGNRPPPLPPLPSLPAPVDPDRCMQVLHEHQVVKSLPLKGMVGHVLSLEQFLTHMLQQARLRSLQERKYRTAAFAAP